MSMEIRSNYPYPSNILSNFGHNRFILDGVTIESMEGFLQAMKDPDITRQLNVCKLWGYNAKKAGFNINWYAKQEMYWQGVAYKRSGSEYANLIKRAYTTLADTNESFAKALLITGDTLLQHNMGGTLKHKTILTRYEFCDVLTQVRKTLTDQTFYLNVILFDSVNKIALNQTVDHMLHIMRERNMQIVFIGEFQTQWARPKDIFVANVIPQELKLNILSSSTLNVGTLIIKAKNNDTQDAPNTKHTVTIRI